MRVAYLKFKLEGNLAGINTTHSQRHGIVVNGVGLINEVNQRRARLVLGWAGKPSWYVVSQLDQLSIPSLRGRQLSTSYLAGKALFAWVTGKSV